MEEGHTSSSLSYNALTPQPYNLSTRVYNPPYLAVEEIDVTP